jgi:hypothetical protein
MFPKTSEEFKFLSKLNTPEKIQSYLEKIPFNHERSGETCMSVRRVLLKGRAHCFEGAFLACACLMLMGEKPIIVNMNARKPDYDHILVIFRRNGFYGAMSKTNHPVLRYRDPVYRSVRELVMSYFHEYYLFKKGNKTLLGYTKPINMKRFGTRWITAEEDLWDLAKTVYFMPIFSVIPKKNKRSIRKATTFERKAFDIQQSR